MKQSISTEAKEITVNSDFRFYTSSPAPHANPEGRLDGAWRILRVDWIERRRQIPVVVAYFKFDGRDQCEFWAHRHGIQLNTPLEVR